MSSNRLLLPVLAALAALAVPAWGQEASGSAPVELMGGDTERNGEKSGAAPDIGAISVTPAMSISLDTLGLYDEKSGGVGFAVWEGSDHARVKFLLGKIPETIPSPTVRRLLAKLLLSTTRPPKSVTIQQNVFRERMQTLLHIDELAQAQRLLEMIPQDLRTPETARLEFTTHLLKGETDWICDRIGGALEQYAGKSVQWQKYAVFCLAREGKEAEAQLRLDLLAEQQAELDAGFLALMDVMLGRGGALASRFSTPLSLDDAAMIAVSGTDAFPEGYLDAAPLPVVRLVKDNPQFSSDLREKADKRLAAAIALEKPLRHRAELRDWLRQQFAQAPEKPFDVDKAFAQLQAKGKSAGEPRDTRRAYRLYTMLQALDFSDLRAGVPWDVATFRDSGRIHVSPALRSEMAGAVGQELTGEAILLLAIAAGQVNDLAEVDDASIADMVQALMQLGYHADAQALAAEAMSALY